jgi:hypothetical protein
LAIIEAIEAKNNWFMYDLNKKFFKLTLNTFRTCAQEYPTLIEKFDVLCENINKSNQLGSVDLYEMVYEYNDLKLLKNQTKFVNKNVPEASSPKTDYNFF